MADLQSVRNIDPIQMTLGGRVRTLQFDLNAFAELEKLFGSVEEALKSLGSKNMAGIKTVLWAALIHEEAIIDEITGEPTRYNITPYQVGSWIKNPLMLNEISEKLIDALGADQPQESLEAAKQAMVKKLPEGVAKVVMTDEEKAAAEVEARKNG